MLCRKRAGRGSMFLIIVSTLAVGTIASEARAQPTLKIHQRIPASRETESQSHSDARRWKHNQCRR